MTLFPSFRSIIPIPINRRLITGLSTIAISLLTTRLRNSKSKRGPAFVTWLPTFNCNAYCLFCGTHVLHKKQPENLTRKRALQLAHEIGQAKTWVVGFTGGEVLMWPYLFEVIRTLKQYGVVVYIVSNGLLLKKYVSEILDAGVDNVVISIDSNSAEEHDGVRKVEGLFEQAIDGIKELKARRTAGKPVIKTTTVVSRQNINSLESILSDLNEIADQVSFQPIVSDYSDSPHNRTKTRLHDFLFDKGGRNIVDQHFDELLQKNKKFNTSYYRLIPTFLYDPEYLVARIRCWSPFLRMQILPDGSVRHCTVRSDYGSIGNLNETSFVGVWNSREMIRQREEIRWHNNKCICWTQDTAFNAVIHSSKLGKLLPVLKSH